MCIGSEMNRSAVEAIVASMNLDSLKEDTKYAGLDNPDWRPYCPHCNSFARMKPDGEEFVCDPLIRDYAWRRGCGGRVSNKRPA